MAPVNSIDINPIHYTVSIDSRRRGSLISLPISKHLLDLRAICKSIHILEILFGQLEWSRRHIWDVFPDQFTRIDCRLIDFLQ